MSRNLNPAMRSDKLRGRVTEKVRSYVQCLTCDGLQHSGQNICPLSHIIYPISFNIGLVRCLGST